MPSDCTQRGCPTPPILSLVWPGAGRQDYCLAHAFRAMSILEALGISPGSVDVQLAADVDPESATEVVRAFIGELIERTFANDA